MIIYSKFSEKNTAQRENNHEFVGDFLTKFSFYLKSFEKKDTFCDPLTKIVFFLRSFDENRVFLGHSITKLALFSRYPLTKLVFPPLGIAFAFIPQSFDDSCIFWRNLPLLRDLPETFAFILHDLTKISFFPRLVD